MVNVACHTVKKSGVSRGWGRDRSLQTMRCEIILDMFGKSRRLMTPAGAEGDGGSG